MESPKIEEHEVAPGVVVGYQAVKLEPAVSDDYVLFSIEKMYVQIEFEIGTSKHRFGANIVPPAGKEIIVASCLKNGAQKPEGTLSTEEQRDQILKIADWAQAYKTRMEENSRPAQKGEF